MKRMPRLLSGLVFPILFVSFWYALSSNSQNPYFPPLSKSFKVFSDSWFGPLFMIDLLPSVQRFISGFFLGTLFGISLGILIGLNVRLRKLLFPVIEFLRSIPTAALVPLALIILGTGYKMETALITVAVFFPILISTTDGVRSVDRVNLEVGRSYGLSQWQSFVRITLPASIPRVLSGGRLALAVGLAATVISNMCASSSGLGFFIINAQSNFDLPAMWAGLMAIGLLGFMANSVFLLAQWKLLKWHRGWRSSTVETN